ncbi:MAG TPA: hypothetical protein DEB57_06470 [Microbacterium sp.]|nr:hypothetical protein [Microbacterium sp.]
MDAAAHNTVYTLAQQNSSDAVWDVVIWVIVLIVAVMVLGIILMHLRRIMRESADSETQGLLLDDLRRLRNEGHLSTEEYQRAVDALAERMGSSANPGGDSRPVK